MGYICFMDTSLNRSALLDKKKRDAFSVLVHHLNNLLTSVHFFSEYMTDQALEEEEKKQIAQEMFTNVNNTTDICMNLYFSHIFEQPGGDKPESRHFDAGELVHGAAQSYEIPARKKRIKLHTFVENDLWTETDPNILQLIVKNLISNAIKFTPAGGKVFVKALDYEGELLITVEDSGSGMSPERQLEIFQPGIVPAYGTENEKGGGMGLYLCQQFTARLGGKIWFSSVPGKGSDFSVAIPLVREAI